MSDWRKAAVTEAGQWFWSLRAGVGDVAAVCEARPLPTGSRRTRAKLPRFRGEISPSGPCLLLGSTIAEECSDLLPRMAIATIRALYRWGDNNTGSALNV